MRENRIVTLAIALLFVISIAAVPAAEASPKAWHSVFLSRPDPLIVPSDVFQNSPRIEWRKELRLPNKPFGSGEFHFLPHMAPESQDGAPLERGDWC